MNNYIARYQELKDEQDNLEQEVLEFKANFNEKSRKKLIEQIKTVRLYMNNFVQSVKNCYLGGKNI